MKKDRKLNKPHRIRVFYQQCAGVTPND